MAILPIERKAPVFGLVLPKKKEPEKRGAFCIQTKAGSKEESGGRKIWKSRSEKQNRGQEEISEMEETAGKTLSFCRWGEALKRILLPDKAKLQKQ